MADLFVAGGTPITVYTRSTGVHDFNATTVELTVTDNDGGDNEFTTVEALFINPTSGTSFNATFAGLTNIGGTNYPVFNNLDLNTTIVYGIQLDPGTYPTVTDLNLNTADFTVCFGAGTLIQIPEGTTKVELLQIGDVIRTSGGGVTRVKWIGRQTVQKLFSGPRMQPVRIRAGALGDGLPHSNLTVTADHGMVIDGLVINASALVNGGSIAWVPMDELPDQVTYYHIETEAHDVILANGAPAETFVDIPGRMAFDNYGEYLELYGAERIIPEMARPRIASQRLVPETIRARLGIPLAQTSFEELSVA